ncbi:B-cell antigen receptor complex-associated protein beta chain [Salvelinus namaycush]|uniref:B-cell antigen receptor complex-associated protein beta chain n=1 Tax=Salvelinus namaycush TaxID=8040 RepID=A0A8U0UCC2_SALNM|nr:B-cell antigen receptor complex-associated protein beta chain [Salvelinus namaycush]
MRNQTVGTPTDAGVSLHATVKVLFFCIDYFGLVQLVLLQSTVVMLTTMCWLLVGCCGLAFVNLSVALNSTLHVTQKPRFYGVKTNRNVTIFCMVSDRNQSATVEWYKASEYNTTRKKIEGDRVTVRQKSMLRNALIELSRVETEDTGLYFCLINNITWGPGTELQVFRPSNAENAERRSKLKDALIFLQALLLTLFALVPLLRHQSLLKKEDAIYEEPEHDHIYEGLEIEHCGGLYEDISAYAQPGPAEAAAAWKQE